MKRGVKIVAVILLLAGMAKAELKEHWRLDEGTGGTAFNSAGYKDGTLWRSSGAVLGGGIWQPSDGLGGSLQLTASERATIPSVDLGASWTVMGWIKPTAPGGGFARFITSWYLDGFYLGLNGSNQWTFIVNLGHVGGNGALLIGPSYNLNAWQHVAGVYSSGYITLYVDGIGFGPYMSAPPSVPNQEIFIGSDFRFGDPSIAGLYDDVAVYNTALDGTAIWNIYQDGLAGKSINNWQAKNPSPADNAVDQALAVTLSWTTGSNPPSAITNHVLYFGTNPDNVFNSTSTSLVGDTQVVTLPVGTTSHAPGFSSDKTIYWRVDEKAGSTDIARGAVWTFATVKNLAQITQQPQNQRAFAGTGASVTFTVSATSPSPMTYLWYKGSSSIPTATLDHLTINNVSESDANSYHVVITNAAGPQSSNSASLILKKLIGHWPLDVNANDASGFGNNGVLINTPTFVAGKVGTGAVSLDSAQADFIDIPNESHFDVYDEFTASFWMNDANLPQADWCTMLGKGGNNGGWNVNQFLYLGFISGHLDYTPDLANNDTPSFVVYDVPVMDGQWHLITFVYDGTNESIYIDGALQQQGPAIQAVSNDAKVSIGATRGAPSTGFLPGAYFNGKLDDVRIYNYALNAQNIAQLYYDVTGEPVCITRPTADISGDCKVKLEDFAILAGQWLNCSLSPAGCP